MGALGNVVVKDRKDSLCAYRRQIIKLSYLIDILEEGLIVARCWCRLVGLMTFLSCPPTSAQVYLSTYLSVVSVVAIPKASHGGYVGCPN